MKMWLGRLGIFLTALMLGGCGGAMAPTETDQWIEPNGRLKVLSSIAMIDDLVREIGGDAVDAITLIQGQLDPHTYELVKGDDEKLTYADVVFYCGLQLEHGPSLRHHLEANPKAVGLGDWIERQDPGAILRVDGQPDPHIWTDISLWQRTVEPIVESLSRLRPEQASAFRERAAILNRKMTEAHERVRALMQCIQPEKRFLVTSHDAFNYFCRAYLAEPKELKNDQWMIRCEAPEGLAPDSQLSTLDIQRLIKHMKKNRISVLFPESNVSQDSIRKILDAGSQLGMDLTIAEVTLYADAMGGPGSDGETYLKMIEHNGRVIAKYLDAQCL